MKRYLVLIIIIAFITSTTTEVRCELETNYTDLTKIRYICEFWKLSGDLDSLTVTSLEQYLRHRFKDKNVSEVAEFVDERSMKGLIIPARYRNEEVDVYRFTFPEGEGYKVYRISFSKTPSGIIEDVSLSVIIDYTDVSAFAMWERDWNEIGAPLPPTSE